MSFDNRAALYVVAPCYIEKDVLPEFLRRVGAVFDSVGRRIRIMAVDNVIASVSPMASMTIRGPK